MTERARCVVRRLTSMAIGLMLVAGASAEAQPEWEGNGFISISGGGQFGDTAFEAPLETDLFNEVAVFETDHTSGNGGLLDVAGGIRLFGNLGASVGFTLMENQADVTGSGTVPNPLFFDRPRTVTYQETGLKHREIGVHLSAIYVVPLSERLVVSIFGGPTIFNLRQDLVSNIRLGPELDAPFFDIVNVASVTTTTFSNSGVGAHIGFDGTFLLTEQLGAGVAIRYAGGSVDLESDSATIPIDVGGLQFSGGLRLLF